MPHKLGTREVMVSSASRRAMRAGPLTLLLVAHLAAILRPASANVVPPGGLRGAVRSDATPPPPPPSPPPKTYTAPAATDDRTATATVSALTTTTTSTATLAWTTSVTTAAVTTTPTTTSTTTLLPGYNPKNPALLKPSDAPMFTFYMYRAVGDSTFPLEGVNTGTLAGVLWYLHHEVVIIYPTKFLITRVVRYKVKTRATQPLFDRGMNFGVRYAFDSGRCTGPYICGQMWDYYGYHVGCNNLGEWPYPTFKIFYPGAIWYSLPGVCPDRTWLKRDAACEEHEPGGACEGDPTGQGNCTYSYEPAGEITLDELQKDRLPGPKFVNFTSFWDGIHDESACTARLERARDLFRTKYPDLPLDSDLLPPTCDFNQDGFYADVP